MVLLKIIETIIEYPIVSLIIILIAILIGWVFRKPKEVVLNA